MLFRTEKSLAKLHFQVPSFHKYIYLMPWLKGAKPIKTLPAGEVKRFVGFQIEKPETGFLDKFVLFVAV